jgi:hypothetical protein
MDSMVRQRRLLYLEKARSKKVLLKKESRREYEAEKELRQETVEEGYR